MAQHDVVICYAPGDRSAAEAACAALEARGARCWVSPRDLPAGAADERGATLAALAHGRALLRLVPTAGAGEPALTAADLERVVNDGVTVIPVRPDPAALGPQYQQLAETLRSLPRRPAPPPIEAVSPAELAPVPDEPARVEPPAAVPVAPPMPQPPPPPTPAGAALFSAVPVRIDAHTALATAGFPFAPAPVAEPAPAPPTAAPVAAAPTTAATEQVTPPPLPLPTAVLPLAPQQPAIQTLAPLSPAPAPAASKAEDEADGDDGEKAVKAPRPFPRKLALAAASVALAASACGFLYARLGRPIRPSVAAAGGVPVLAPGVRLAAADPGAPRPTTRPAAGADNPESVSPAGTSPAMAPAPADTAPRMALLPAADLDRRLKAVFEAAEAAGLSVDSIKTRKTIRRPGYDLVPVEMTASAGFAGHLKFLRALHGDFADAGLDEFELSGISAAPAGAGGRKIRCKLQFAWCTAPATPTGTYEPTPLRQRDWSGVLSLVSGATGKDLALTGMRLELMDGPEGRAAPSTPTGDRRRADHHTARVRLKGEAATEVAIAGLVSKLAGSKGVRDVRLVSAGVASGERARRTFEVELTVSGDGQARVLVAGG